MLFAAGCLTSTDQSTHPPAAGGNSSTQLIQLETQGELIIWHTFSADSKEEDVFIRSIAEFERMNEHVSVVITRVPYSNAHTQFMVAAQGGEAPDLIRLSSDQLGEIGEVRVDGFPLLEDLRAHLTPMDRSLFDERALHAMKYGSELLGLPASQDCLSLLWNDALFPKGAARPHDNWTIEEMLEIAKNLTAYEQGPEGSKVSQAGLSLPVKVPYWWFPFQSGFGGRLFDEYGSPSLNSSGSAESLEYLFDLEQKHLLMHNGTQRENMKTHFLNSEAAMIIDGPWNWATYETVGRLNVSQTLLPYVSSTGERMSPLVTFKGWSVSKRSQYKESAVELALHLTSVNNQRNYAIETYTLPTARVLYDDQRITSNPVLSGFIEQLQLGTPAPTNRAMSLVYGPLSTAFDNVYSTEIAMDPNFALQAAQEELISKLEE